MEEQERLLDSAVRILRACGVNAGWQQTGGDANCLVVAEADGDLDEPKFWFGAAGDTWAAEVEGDPSGLWTDVASDEDNPAQLARGVLDALTRFARNQA
ncbi:MAG: hypothetical protein AB7T37_06855 [Dehalococcoidia bacterium]